MSQHQVLEIARDVWENEGGALPGLEPSRVVRFLTELYVVYGLGKAGPADTSSRFRTLRQGAEKL